MHFPRYAFCFALMLVILAKPTLWAGMISSDSDPLERSGRSKPAQAQHSNSLWSVKPLAGVSVPSKVDPWCRSPLDQFVLAKLKEHHLEPSLDADRQTLIRRLYFDLHGLPPSPEEVEAFVSDPSDRAYEQLVDRLLASPRYGERWGRHWLDVVHYADTHGYDKDHRRPNAWPYRDYVIRSLNEDKPYGRFVREQLAGDILNPEDPQAIAATGFIVAGPWDMVGHTELKEGALDKNITRLLDRDDMVANTFSTFCSLTVHCARCHNHKFDPITQQDYYSLQAVFAGVDRAERTYDADPDRQRKRIRLSQEQNQLEEKCHWINQMLAAISRPEFKNLDDQISTLQAIESGRMLSNRPLPSVNLGFRSKSASSRYATKWIQLDLGQLYPLDEIALVPLHWRDNGYPGPGYGFPRRFKIEIASEPDFKTPIIVADESGADFPNPGDIPYVTSAHGRSGRYVKLAANRLWSQESSAGDWQLALSELVVMSGARNVALGAMVRVSDSHDDRPTWHTRYLVDGQSSESVLFNPSPTDGFQSAVSATPDNAKWVQLDLGRSLPIDQVTLVPARSRSLPDRLGYGFPPRFRIEAANDAEFSHPEIIVDKTTTDVPNRDARPLFFAAKSINARYVRITATQLWQLPDTNQFLFALGEVQVIAGNTNAALTAKVTAMDSTETGPWGVTCLIDGFSSFTSLPLMPAGDGFSSETTTNAETTKWIAFDLGSVQMINHVSLQPARLLEAPDQFGFGFPVRFRIEAALDPEFSQPFVVSDQSTNDFPNPGTGVQTFGMNPRQARFVRVSVNKLWKRSDKEFLFAFGGIEIGVGKTTLPDAIIITASDSLEKDRWGKRFLLTTPNPEALGIAESVVSRMRESSNLFLTRRQLATARETQAMASLSPQQQGEILEVKHRLEQLDIELADLPAPQTVFAAAHQFVESGTFTPASKPRPIHLLKRGDINQPGPLMNPAALECVANLKSDLYLGADSSDGERRVALAGWLADTGNVIVWRSIVNRIWFYHFGRGIVDTPNDFGRMGSPPTHPELLDWLTSEFLAHGQSLKWLHRTILTSATYRQKSAQKEEFALTDSGNQFLWRMNRDRLDAESVRDSILSICGKLDLTMGGPGYDLFEFKDDPSPHYLYDRHAADEPNGLRRSVYRFIVRSVPDPFMETLDCADPSQSVPVRNTTITALQALSLLNNAFVVRMAELFADRLKEFSPDPTAQMNRAFGLCFGRKPTEAELAEFLDHTGKYGLANTCRLIFNSNEFLFVD